MKCPDVNLPDFLNGELDAGEMERTLQHLEQCPACQAVFQQMLALRVQAPEIERSLSPKFYDFPRPARAAGGWWWRLGAVAAVLIALAGGLFVVLHLLRQDPAVQLAEVLENRAYEYVPPVIRGPDEMPPDPARENVLALYVEGRYAEFLRAAGTRLAAQPDDERLLFFSGVAAYQLGRYAEAESLLERALASDPYRRPEVIWYLANTFLRRQETAKGRRLLEELATLDHPYSRRAREVMAVLDRFAAD
ncbi:MAG: tetratricopeptide repeat protein [Acidobacteria bacterium]|nr:tetratricopeptide repeat protein [Acidobacteriota bacterium]